MLRQVKNWHLSVAMSYEEVIVFAKTVIALKAIHNFIKKRFSQVQPCDYSTINYYKTNKIAHGWEMEAWAARGGDELSVLTN